MSPTPTAPGVYADLHELAALEQRTRGFSFLPRQPVQSLLSGRHASRLRGRGLNFEEVRRYQPGDDVRTIDWKVTARTRKPYTRVFTEERERPLLLVVDQRLSMFFGSRSRLKSVTAAEVAALVAWKALAAQDRVGAVVFNDGEARDVRPRRSRGTVLRILQTVVEQNHALRADAPTPPGPGMFNEALRRASRLAAHDYLVCLISDATGSDTESRQLLTALARHNDVVVVFVYDPLEESAPAAGRLVVSDGARQLELDTDDKAARDRFHEDLVDRLGQARQFLLGRQVPLLPVHTAEDVAPQLRRLLGAGPKPQVGP